MLDGIDLICDSAPVGLCVLDLDLRFLRINGRLAEINGVPAADHIGRTVREVHPEMGKEVETGLRRVISTGKAALDVEVSGETPARPGVSSTRTTGPRSGNTWRPASVIAAPCGTAFASDAQTGKRAGWST